MSAGSALNRSQKLRLATEFASASATPEEALRRFALRFLKQKIQLAGRGIFVHLVIPAGLLTRAEPLDQALVFFWRQVLDCYFDFLNPIHTRSHLTEGPPLIGGWSSATLR